MNRILAIALIFQYQKLVRYIDEHLASMEERIEQNKLSAAFARAEIKALRDVITQTTLMEQQK